MVSIKTLNKVVKSISLLTLSTKDISEDSDIRLSEVKHALKVLMSHGYVHKTNFEKDYKESGVKGITYSASESAKEILNSGGFTQQLSMKEKGRNKTINKNISIKDSTVNGDVNYEPLFSKSPKNINVQATPTKNDDKSMLFYVCYEWVNNNKILCGIIIAILIGIFKKQTLFSWLHYILN